MVRPIIASFTVSLCAIDGHPVSLSTYNAALIPFHHTPAGYNSHVPCCPRFGLLDAPTHPTPNTTPVAHTSCSSYAAPAPPQSIMVFLAAYRERLKTVPPYCLLCGAHHDEDPHPHLARRRVHRLLPHSSLTSSAFTCTRRIPFSAPTFPPPPTCASSAPLKDAAEDWSLMIFKPPVISSLDGACCAFASSDMLVRNMAPYSRIRYIRIARTLVKTEKKEDLHWYMESSSKHALSL
ncbi:hypothetical protein B0H13DRAFT_2394356 [Mycena leptocephala]|nr:hypothetical protein B0H13DRAFT_2394356 [Mycena leptocephala]